MVVSGCAVLRLRNGGVVVFSPRLLSLEQAVLTLATSLRMNEGGGGLVGVGG